MGAGKPGGAAVPATAPPLRPLTPTPRATTRTHASHPRAQPAHTRSSLKQHSPTLPAETAKKEYQDALALSNAVHSLHVDGPLDAAHLEHSPGSHDPYADSADEDLSDSMADFNGYDRAHSPMAAYGGSALAHDGGPMGGGVLFEEAGGWGGFVLARRRARGATHRRRNERAVLGVFLAAHVARRHATALPHTRPLPPYHRHSCPPPIP
eukprot:scaffold22036_cov96-Isochrysis_galbana.AAC.1